MARLADRPAARILDYCAGGGGKALALADLLDSPVTAHDAAPARMRDLPVRATRAGAQITVVTTAKLRGSFDLVLCDAPCSGSGTWRRAPQAKMDLTAARLDALHALQDEVLEKGAARVGPKGRLAYATCSVLHSENTARVQDFLSRHPEFSIVSTESWTPDTLQDGFFLAVMERDVVC